MQAVALCSDVPALPSPRATLPRFSIHRIDAESCRPQVADALVRLVGDDRLRAGDDGYHIQSPEQKDWEKTRKGKEPRPADAIRIRKAMIRQALTGLSVTKGRSFKVELWVEGEKLADGDVALHVEEADATRRDQLRNSSREEAATNRVTWVYSLGDETYQSIEEWYRSDEMIKSKETPVQDVGGGRAARRGTPAPQPDRTPAHRAPDPRHDGRAGCLPGQPRRCAQRNNRSVGAEAYDRSDRGHL